MTPSRYQPVYRHVGPTGVCGGCGEKRGVRSDQTIRTHRIKGLVCAGSRRPPVDEPVTVTAEQIMSEHTPGGASWV